MKRPGVNITKNNRQKRYVKLGFSQSKKKVCESVRQLLFNIYIGHHEKLRFYKKLWLLSRMLHEWSHYEICVVCPSFHQSTVSARLAETVTHVPSDMLGPLLVYTNHIKNENHVNHGFLTPRPYLCSGSICLSKSYRQWNPLTC